MGEDCLVQQDISNLYMNDIFYSFKSGSNSINTWVLLNTNIQQQFYYQANRIIK